MLLLEVQMTELIFYKELILHYLLKQYFLYIVPKDFVKYYINSRKGSFPSPHPIVFRSLRTLLHEKCTRLNNLFNMKLPKKRRNPYKRYKDN